MKSHLVLVFGVIGLIVFNTALGFGPRHVTIECPREAQVGAWNIGEWTGSGFVAAYLEGASIQEVGARILAGMRLQTSSCSRDVLSVESEITRIYAVLPGIAGP